MNALSRVLHCFHALSQAILCAKFTSRMLPLLLLFHTYTQTQTCYKVCGRQQVRQSVHNRAHKRCRRFLRIHPAHSKHTNISTLRRTSFFLVHTHTHTHILVNACIILYVYVDMHVRVCVCACVFAFLPETVINSCAKHPSTLPAAAAVFLFVLRAGRIYLER